MDIEWGGEGTETNFVERRERERERKKWWGSRVRWEATQPISLPYHPNLSFSLFCSIAIPTNFARVNLVTGCSKVFLFTIETAGLAY